MRIKQLESLIEKADAEYKSILIENGITASSDSCFRLLLNQARSEAKNGIIPDTYKAKFRRRLEEVKNTAELCKKYGRNTKFDAISEGLKGFEILSKIMSTSWAPVIDKIADISCKMGNRKSLEYVRYFNSESYYDTKDMHDIQTDICKRYELKPQILKILTFGMAITLDSKLVGFDSNVVVSKYGEICGVSEEVLNFRQINPVSQSYKVLIQLGRYTLLDILKHDFRDTNHWPFKDDLHEILGDCLESYNMNQTIISKLNMIGRKDYKGLSMVEMVYVLTLKEMAESSKKVVYISLSELQALEKRERGIDTP